MSDTNLAERVCDLEERVAYLEKELELSVDERRFEKKIRNITRTAEEYEIRQDGPPYKARVTIQEEALPYASHLAAGLDNIGWEMVEHTDDMITINIIQGFHYG